MIELKVDEFKDGLVTFHIERQEYFKLGIDGMQCGVYRIKKECYPEFRKHQKIFFVRGQQKSKNKLQMKAFIQDYLDLIESINIFNMEMKHR